jgi:hypothetical protein
MQELSSTTRSNDRFSWPLAAALIVWIVIAVAGWYGISAYGFSGDPLATADAVKRWPAESSIARMKGRSTLVLFLHPKCPCSRATVTELERLSVLVPSEALPDICVVAAAPRATGDLWWSSPLLARAARLPNAHVLRDPGGVETALFGARVSGTVMLFDPQGNRLYAGGVTMARGHAGDNVGLHAVTKLLVDRDAKTPSIPPFGCEVVRESQPPFRTAPSSSDGDRALHKESPTGDHPHAPAPRSAGGESI